MNANLMRPSCFQLRLEQTHLRPACQQAKYGVRCLALHIDGKHAAHHSRLRYLSRGSFTCWVSSSSAL